MRRTQAAHSLPHTVCGAHSIGQLRAQSSRSRDCVRPARGTGSLQVALQICALVCKSCATTGPNSSYMRTHPSPPAAHLHSPGKAQNGGHQSGEREKREEKREKGSRTRAWLNFAAPETRRKLAFIGHTRDTGRPVKARSQSTWLSANGSIVAQYD